MNRRLYTQNRTVDNARKREYGGEYVKAPPPYIPEPEAKPVADGIGGVFGGGLVRSILGYLPPGVYNIETKKLFGILTAEDLLLVALILLIADSDKDDNAALLIALVYILLT